MSTKSPARPAKPGWVKPAGDIDDLAPRIMRDYAVGMVLAIAAGIFDYSCHVPSDSPWKGVIVGLVLALCCIPAAFLASMWAFCLVAGCVAVLSALAEVLYGHIGRRARSAIAIAAIAAGVLATWWIAKAAAAGLVSALPSALPLLCGAFAAAQMIYAHPSPGRWADAFVILSVVIGSLTIIWPATVTGDAAAPLLFLAIGWLAVRTWRQMNASGNRVVRASADVATALLLCATLDLVVIWIANLTGPRVLTVLRASRVLDAIAAGSNPDWWYLTAPLLLLTVVYAALIHWGRKPGPGVSAASGLLRFSRRTMTVTHVGLLLVPLVGLTVPTVLGQSVLGQLRPRYVIAYHADLAAQAEILAYRQLTRDVAAASPRQRAALRGSVAKITQSAGAGGGGPGGSGGRGGGIRNATPTQLTSALKLGKEEGEYLEYKGQAPAVGESSPPPLDADSVTKASAEGEAEVAAAREAEDRADKAGTAAAETIASLLSASNAGTVVQILQEYLSGLVEERPVADVFAELAKRIAPEDTADPSIEQVLDPDEAEKAVTEGKIGSSGSGSKGPGDDNGDRGGR
jgi:hypothetical protein